MGLLTNAIVQVAQGLQGVATGVGLTVASAVLRLFGEKEVSGKMAYQANLELE